MKSYQGIAASPGYASGPVHAIRQRAIVPVRRVVDPEQVGDEIARFGQAVEKARAGLQELIDRLGLSHRTDHVLGQLSSGERQRTALARALLNRPQVILADEPTGNLDQANAALVLEQLREFAREGAVLLVTHDEQALEYAQRVVRMEAGQLTTT